MCDIQTRFLNRIFRPVLKLLEPTRHDPVLKRFPNAHELHGDCRVNRPVSAIRGCTLAVSVACVTIYELLLKRGAAETANPNSQLVLDRTFRDWDSVYVWIAIGFVILSLITWLNVLRYLPLSIAFPISQAVHVLVPLGSWLVLGENIVTLRWIGIAFVSLGLAVVAKPVARLEEGLVTAIALVIVLIALVAHAAGQIVSETRHGFFPRGCGFSFSRMSSSRSAIGIALMTAQFFSQPRIAPALRPQLHLSVPGAERDHHHLHRWNYPARKTHAPAGDWFGPDQRRRRAGLDDIGGSGAPGWIERSVAR